MKRTFFLLAAGIILTGILVTGVLAMGPFNLGEDMTGKKAFVFTLKDTQGKETEVAQYLGKQPVIIFFWTTWCPHCRRQLSHLEKESGKIKEAGAELILVDVQESAGQVSKFLKGINIPLDSLLDENSQVAEKYEVIGVPTFVIVGSDGTIKFHGNFLPYDYQKFLAEK